jgi:FtsH-binding integral membrane protein
MKTFAHHHSDTPHGESHAPISISVLLTFLFIGAQWVIFTLMAVTTRVDELSMYQGTNPFTVGSIVVAVLLLLFLAVDFRRNRIEAHGGSMFQLIVFGLAGVLLGLFMIFIIRVIQYGGPPPPAQPL